MPVQFNSDSVSLVSALLLMIVAGIAMSLGALLAGKLVRRKVPHNVKGQPYECGEPSIGSSWVQFDLRFYVVALLFIIFDAEIVLLYPWAVTFKQAGWAGLADLLIFLGIIVVGFAFLWKQGYLAWVRSVSAQPGPHSSAENGPGSVDVTPEISSKSSSLPDLRKATDP